MRVSGKAWKTQLPSTSTRVSTYLHIQGKNIFLFNMVPFFRVNPQYFMGFTAVRLPRVARGSVLLSKKVPTHAHIACHDYYVMRS